MLWMNKDVTIRDVKVLIAILVLPFNTLNKQPITMEIMKSQCGLMI